MAKTLMDSLGIELLEMTEDKVVTMPVDERTHQPFGFTWWCISCVGGNSSKRRFIQFN